MEKRGNWTDNECWYASAQDAGRTALVLGPFRTEADCRKWAYGALPDGGSHLHAQLLNIACKLDPRSWFYAWGMVKLQNGHKDGSLNAKMPDDVQRALDCGQAELVAQETLN